MEVNHFPGGERLFGSGYEHICVLNRKEKENILG